MHYVVLIVALDATDLGPMDLTAAPNVVSSSVVYGKLSVLLS